MNPEDILNMVYFAMIIIAIFLIIRSLYRLLVKEPFTSKTNLMYGDVKIRFNDKPNTPNFYDMVNDADGTIVIPDSYGWAKRTTPVPYVLPGERIIRADNHDITEPNDRVEKLTELSSDIQMYKTCRKNNLMTDPGKHRFNSSEVELTYDY